METDSQIEINAQVNFNFASYFCPWLIAKEGEALTKGQEFGFHVFNTSVKVQ